MNESRVRISRKFIFFLICLLGIAVRGWIVCRCPGEVPPIEQKLSRVGSLYGVVVEAADSGVFASRVILRVRSSADESGISRKPTGWLVRLQLPGARTLYPGDLVEVGGVALSKNRPPLNPGGADLRGYWERKHVFVEGTAGDVRIVGTERNFLQSIVIESRKRAASLFDRYFRYHPEERVLVETLSIGRETVPGFLRELGIRTGTYHLLVISGLHIGFIYLFLRLLFFPFFTLRHRHPKLFSSVALLVLWYYTAVTGMEVPVVRATLMFSFFLLGEIIEREIPILDSLLAAAILLLLVNPLSILDAGFQLSFAATAGILLFPRFWQAVSSRRFFLSEYLQVSFGAQLFALPLLFFHFHRFYPMSIVDNLIAVPLAGWTTLCSLLFFLCPPVFSLPLRFLATVMLRILVILSQWTPSCWFSLNLPGLLCCGALLALLMTRQNRKMRWVCAAAAVFLLVFSIVPFPREKKESLRVVVFACGSPLVFLQDGTACALFCPDGDGAGTVERVLAPFLRQERIRRVDGVFFTEASSDHMGCVASLTRLVRVGRVYELPEATKSFSHAFFQAHWAPRLRLSPLSEGAEVSCGSFRARLLRSVGMREGPVFAVRRGEKTMVIAPCLGKAGSECLRGRSLGVLYIHSADILNAVRENAASSAAEVLVLPRPLKKFDALGVPARETFYLENGAVIVDFSGDAPTVSQYRGG